MASAPPTSSPIMLASVLPPALAWAGREDALRSLAVVRPNTDWNVRDERGFAALHHAAAHGNASMAALLLDAGAAEAVTDATGATPMHLAARYGCTSVVEMLLDHGADPNAQRASGHTPLAEAAAAGHIEVVQCLLEHGAMANLGTQEGATPLHLAAAMGCGAVIGALLSMGAGPNQQDDCGETALHWAVRESQAEAVTALMAHPGTDANAANEDGETPMHLAACVGDQAMAQLLSRNGASGSVTNSFGLSPAQEAFDESHTLMAHFLRSAASSSGPKASSLDVVNSGVAAMALAHPDATIVM